MKNGNFSKKYTSNLDDVALPPWLTLVETSAVTISKNMDSIGGLNFKRTSTNGSKTLSMLSIADESLSAVSIDAVVNGLTSGSLDIGVYVSENDYAFLKFWAGGSCQFLYCKDGVSTTVEPVYLRNTESSKIRAFKVTYNFKEKTFEVKKNNGAVYLSLDNIDINRTAMIPIVRWNNTNTASEDKLFFIEIEKFYM